MTAPKISEELVEVAALALCFRSFRSFIHRGDRQRLVDKNWPEFIDHARAVLTAVLPQIRREVLEEAAKVVEFVYRDDIYANGVSLSEAILALAAAETEGS